MNEFFEVLNAALDEAIADAKKPYLKREVVSKEEEPRPKQKNFRKKYVAKWLQRRAILSAN